MKKILSMVLIFFLVFSSGGASGNVFNSKTRLRISHIQVNLKEPIEVGEKFNVSVTVTNKLWHRVFSELHAYITCIGLPQKEIGNISVVIPGHKNKDITIPCEIDWLDASWYQENYNIKVVLFTKPLGLLLQRDISTLESVRVISKFWEKDKLKIEKFDPPQKWETKSNEGWFTQSAVKNGIINVTVLNGGGCPFDVKVVVYMVEGISLGIPIIEGIGETRKELGIGTATIEPKTSCELSINCTLRDADREKREFNVEAFLFANVDGNLYKVDQSTKQSIENPVSDLGEAVVVYGPWIWVIFIAAIGTIFLFAVTIRVLWPLLKIKRNEVEIRRRQVEKKLKKMNETDQKKKGSSP